MPLLFILVPQLSDSRTGVRVPGITFSVLLLMVAAFAVGQGLERAASDSFEAAFNAVRDYALRSPAVDRSELQSFCGDIGAPDCLDERAHDPSFGDTFVADAPSEAEDRAAAAGWTKGGAWIDQHEDINRIGESA